MKALTNEERARLLSAASPEPGITLAYHPESREAVESLIKRGLIEWATVDLIVNGEHWTRVTSLTALGAKALRIDNALRGLP